MELLEEFFPVLLLLMLVIIAVLAVIALLFGVSRPKATAPKGKQVCAACGGESPALARFCRQCGKTLG